MSGEILIVAHAFPFAAIGNDSLVEIRTVAQHADLMSPLYSDSQYGRFNVDGYVTQVPSARGERTPGYTQLFRNGVLETVDSEMIGARASYGLLFPSTAFARALFAFIDRTRRLYAALDVPSPVSIDVAFKGLKNCTLAIAQYWTFYQGLGTRPFDRDVVRLPQLVIDELGSGEDAQALARPLLDALWPATKT